MKNKNKNIMLLLLGITLGLSLASLTRTSLIYYFFPDSKPIAIETTTMSPLSDESGFVLGENTGDFITYKDLIKSEEDSTAALRAQITNDLSEVITNQEASSSSVADQRQNLKITIFGDSMVQTLGDHPYLKEELAVFGYDLELENLAIGSQNILDSLPSILNYEGHTDLVIIESFAYNPMAGSLETALKTHRQALTEAFATIQQKTGAPTYLLLTIAPNSHIFGNGDRGVNWEPIRRQEQVNTIYAYMQNSYLFAGEKGYPVIDCFKPSQINGQGDVALISPIDGIHPSVSGQKFISRQIFTVIKHDILSK